MKNMNTLYKLAGILLLILISSGELYAQKKKTKKSSIYQRASLGNFNRADSLKGQLTSLRSSYDVTFYHLDVEVVPKKETIKGTSAISFKLLSNTQKIQIDLYKKLAIEKIVWNGKNLDFTREHSAVYVNFPITLEKDSSQKIIVHYSGRPLDPDFDIPYYAAFVWDKDKNKNYYVQAICQGNGAHGWWPNKDHLSDEPDSSAVSITVPSKLKAISNGRLKSKTVLENGKTKYEWKTSYPINNYNITLNVGDYAHIQDDFEGINTLTLDYYILRSDSLKAKKAFEIVKPMLKIYEELFGPYPFPNDGLKLIQTPYPMEHQSAVALGNDLDESLILHEVAHEWWGNSVSCTDMAEFWIHEAFATYAISLFIEKQYGIEKVNQYFDSDRNQVMGKYPLLGEFGVNHVHYDLEDVYTKGRLMLHTLRNVINDDVLWFDILKGIQQKFKHQSITTLAIVNYINDKTNTDYTCFFNQYLKHTALPKLQMDVYDKNGRSTLRYRWIANEVGFKMPVKVFLGDKNPAFIYPTTEWKEMELPTMDLLDINIDGNGFYIAVDYGERITKEKSKAYTGVYTLKSKPSRKIIVKEKNSQISVEEKKKWKTNLYFKSSLAAITKNISPAATLSFIKDQNGEIIKIRIKQKEDILEWIKIE